MVFVGYVPLEPLPVQTAIPVGEIIQGKLNIFLGLELIFTL